MGTYSCVKNDFSVFIYLSLAFHRTKDTSREKKLSEKNDYNNEMKDRKNKLRKSHGLNRMRLHCIALHFMECSIPCEQCLIDNLDMRRVFVTDRCFSNEQFALMLHSDIYMVVPMYHTI